MSKRNMSVATGVSASAAPARNPAPVPKDRRTAANTSHTLATPRSTSGTSTDHVLSPKIRTESSGSHREAGGLSTVIDPAASDEPHRNADQLFEPAWMAAV